MKFPELVRMADDEGHNPVWARSKRRRSGGGAGGFIGLIVTLLALFGALTGVLAIKERSVAAGGEVIDGWIQAGWNSALKVVGKAPAAAEVAVDKAGNAAEKTGDALQAGAEKTADELKTQ